MTGVCEGRDLVTLTMEWERERRREAEATIVGGQAIPAG